MNAVGGLLRVAQLACERDGRMLFADLDLALAPGDYLELRGPNGSGKSTLLRAIAGLYPDYTGTIEAAESLYVGHRPGITGLLTAEENLRWYATLRPGGRGVEAALATVGMAGYERVPCEHMSAGQVRRVALARLLICPSPLWLLDEPMTALDASGQGLVRGLIAAQRAAGGAVLCATHQGLELPGAALLSLGLEAPAAGAVGP
ncbi:MAG: heme ABC exporter ATP-binding protein CcmA [Pseudomonadales bacterium]